MRQIKEYDSMDELARSVTNDDEIVAVYAGMVEEDWGIFQFIKALANMSAGEWVVLIGMFVALVVTAGSPELEALIIVVLIGGSLLFLIVRGIRIKPSVFVVGQDKAYFIDDVIYDRKTKKYHYDKIDIGSPHEFESYFKLANLNPFFYINHRNFRFRGTKYLITRSLLLYFIYSGDYPKHKIHALGEFVRKIVR